MADFIPSSYDDLDGQLPAAALPAQIPAAKVSAVADGLQKGAGGKLVAAVGGPAGVGDYVPPSATQGGSSGAPQSATIHQFQPRFNTQSFTTYQYHFDARTVNGEVQTDLSIGYNCDASATGEPQIFSRFMPIAHESGTSYKAQWQVEYWIAGGAVLVTPFKVVASRSDGGVIDTVGTLDAYVTHGAGAGDSIFLAPTGGGNAYLVCSPAVGGSRFAQPVEVRGTQGANSLTIVDPTTGGSLLARMDDAAGVVQTVGGHPLRLGANNTTAMSVQSGTQVTIGSPTLSAADAQLEVTAKDVGTQIFAGFDKNGVLRAKIDNLGVISGPVAKLVDSTGVSSVTASTSSLGLLASAAGGISMNSGTNSLSFFSHFLFATDNTIQLGNATSRYSNTFSSIVTANQLVVGGGTAITGVLSATAALDFAPTAAQTSSDLTIALTGAVVGDTVAIGLPAAPPANTNFSGFVSSANTVTIRFHNYSSGAVDPASATYRATVIRF